MQLLSAKVVFQFAKNYKVCAFATFFVAMLKHENVKKHKTTFFLARQEGGPEAPNTVTSFMILNFEKKRIFKKNMQFSHFFDGAAKTRSSWRR